MLNPDVRLRQLLQSALQHHQSGRLREAEALYREILQLCPRDANALHLLGVLANQVGRHDVAVDLIRQAIALQPENSDPYNNLGIAFHDLGRFDESIAACRKAIALRPNYPEAYCNLGQSLTATGLYDEAISASRQAIVLKPNYPEAYNNLGNALKSRGRLDEAFAAHRQALALRPNYPEAHNNVGAAFFEQGQMDEAIAACHHAITLKPGFYEAYNNLGNALMAKGRVDEGIAAYRQAIVLNPNYPVACNNLANGLKDKGQWDDAIATLRHAIALKPDYVEAHSNLVYAIHYLPDYSAQGIAQELRCWNRQHAMPLAKFVQPHSNDREPRRRLRIGYVSPDFREHSVGRFLLPLLANHDKSQVEVFAYAQQTSSDTMTRRLRSHSDSWRNIFGLSQAQAADLIREDRIDILVDLAMHTAYNRLLVFACKPAPVQVTYLAYCCSTGLQTIDYRLSDPYLDPPGADESIYSEQTIRLPETYWCYQPALDCPDLGPLPALARGFITFGCLSNFYKVSEPALALWAKLLHATRNSQLSLHAPKESHREHATRRLEREGIEPRRVRFIGSASLPDYLRLYREIDIALDTFPYGGGTTTCDALWMGVPMVSLIGKTAVGRGGSSILSNIGLPELVAVTEDQYVQIAGELASDLPRLTFLRSSLRQKMQQSPLMDAPRFTRNIESAYRQMWHKWCASSPVMNSEIRMAKTQ